MAALAKVLLEAVKGWIGPVESLKEDGRGPGPVNGRSQEGRVPTVGARKESAGWRENALFGPFFWNFKSKIAGARN